MQAAPSTNHSNSMKALLEAMASALEGIAHLSELPAHGRWRDAQRELVHEKALAALKEYRAQAAE